MESTAKLVLVSVQCVRVSPVNMGLCTCVRGCDLKGGRSKKPEQPAWGPVCLRQGARNWA